MDLRSYSKSLKIDLDLDMHADMDMDTDEPGFSDCRKRKHDVLSDDEEEVDEEQNREEEKTVDEEQNIEEEEEKDIYNNKPMSSIFKEIAEELEQKANDEKEVNEGKREINNNKLINVIFKEIADELDERHNKYEDLVRKSRDLKIESTRIMYLLDRIDGPENREQILNEANEQITKLVNTVLVKMKVSKSQFHHFVKGVSNGLEEFFDCVSYYYYIKYGEDDEVYYEFEMSDFLLCEGESLKGSNGKGSGDKNKTQEKSQEQEKLSPTTLMFTGFAEELDAMNDKYERLQRRGRDLNIESKRIIFLLHRIEGSTNRNEILEEAKRRLSKLKNTVINAIRADLTKEEVQLYIKAYTNGFQEFVEAVSFYYYNVHKRLITIKECQILDFLDGAPDPNINGESSKIPKDPKNMSTLPLSALITPIIYVLGIADLTGELMRKAITCFGTKNWEEPLIISSLLKDIYLEMQLCENVNLDGFAFKLQTMKSSVEKVEQTVYSINLRRAEAVLLAKRFPNKKNEVERELANIMLNK